MMIVVVVVDDAFDCSTAIGGPTDGAAIGWFAGGYGG